MANVSAFGFSGYDPIMSFVEGSVNGYFDRKSEERAFRNQLKLMREQYQYAQRYAENSPSWNVKGLRAAGLNPILAAAGGSFGGGSVPSVPSTSSHRTSSGHGDAHYDPLTLENFKLLKKQNEALRLDNELKEDSVRTIKSENEVRRLKAEAEAGVLRPELKSEGEPKDGKQINIYVKSKGFNALQKAIRDDYDLRSEKYIRETMDAVFRYGTEVLKLLPIFRRKELLEIITKTTKTAPNGDKSTYETYTTHGPKK